MQLLPANAQKPLLQLTRAAIEGAICQLDEPSDAELQVVRRRHPELEAPAGAFVTIYVEGALRGCLGEIEARDPLIDVVLRCARRATIADYRFEPVRSEELNRLSFKISLLSPLERVTRIDNLEVGRDGLMVRHGGRLGLLLPEVPTENGWDLDTFLRALWRKAGLSSEVRLDQVELFRFTTQQIASEAIGGAHRMNI